MTMIAQASHTSYPSLLDLLRRAYDAFISARQEQADRRIAGYVRNLPDDVRSKLNVSKGELERLQLAQIPT
jgi:hypothetical protein